MYGGLIHGVLMFRFALPLFRGLVMSVVIVVCRVRDFGPKVTILLWADTKYLKYLSKHSKVETSKSRQKGVQ